MKSGLSLRQQLLTAAGVTLFFSVSAKILTLVTSVLLARWLGAAGYGAFAAVAAALAILTIISCLGFPVLTARLMAAYREHENWPLMCGLIAHSSRMVVVVSLLLAFSVSIGAWILRDSMSAVQLYTVWWAMAALPLLAVVELFAAILRGLHRTLISQVPQTLIVPWIFLAALIGWQIVHGGDSSSQMTADRAFSLRLFSIGVAVIVAVWSLLHCLSGQLRSTVARFEIGQWNRSAWPLLFVGLAAVITTQTDIVMLGIFASAEAAGVYQAAARGAELVAFSLVIVATVTQATIARLYITGDLAKLQHLVTTAARGAFALSLPVAVVLIVFAEPLLGSVFGPDFERADGCLIILCVAQLFNVAVGLVGLILNMTGHERDAARGFAIGAITNVLANAILIPIWEIYGAAAATGLSLVVWNAILVVAVRRRVGLRATALG